MNQAVPSESQVALVELLDRALDKGVVVWGEVTVSVADVDLIYVGLKVLLSSVETAERMREGRRDWALASEPRN